MIATWTRHARVVFALVIVSGSPALPAGAHAAMVALSPPTVAADYPGTVALTVDELTPGQTVLVEAYLDKGGDGTINFGDPMVQCFMLTDGEAPSIGGVRNVNVPGDDDGQADGSIHANLRIQAFAEIAKGIAPYVYKVSPVMGGFEAVAAIFEITPLAYPQQVIGTVKRGGSPVPFAYVFLITPDAGGPLVGVVADADGQFTLNTPTGTYTLAAVMTGFVSDLSTAPQVTIAPNDTVTQDLTLIASDASISGQVTDLETTAGIPGVQMIADSGDPGLFGLAVSDAAGNFSLPISKAAPDWGIEVSRNSAALLGYLVVVDEYPVDTGGGDVSGVSIQLPRVTALVYGTLKNDQNQALTGVAVETGNDRYHGVGLTDGSGNYVAGARAGDWRVGPDSDDLLRLGYYVEGANVSLTDGQALRQDLTAFPITTPCVGDCDGSGIVTPDELVTMLSIALGINPVTACPEGVPGSAVTVDQVVRAVNGCPG